MKIRILCLSSALILAFNCAVLSPVEAALIGHWAFDEGEGFTAADSSPGGNDGTINGGATWGSDGVRENHLILNGTDASVDPVLMLPVMDTTNEFTWTIWAKRSTGSTINEVVFGNRYNAVGTADFAPRQFIKLTPTNFEWHQNGNGNDNVDIADMPLDEWHHHAVVKTGATLDYYYDGSLVQSSTLIEIIGIEQLPLFIGGNPGAGAGEHFTGSIDDARIYDNALTAAEVLELVEGVNRPPSFTTNPLELAEAPTDVAYAGTLSGMATDPNPGDTVTYSLLSGPAWLQIAEDGTLSGTPVSSDRGYNVFDIQTSDGISEATATLVIFVNDPNAPAEGDLFGWWPLNEGTGAVGMDMSGNKRHARIMNAETGGLNTDGSVWVDDPECGMVLSFEGTDGTGAFAVAGVPPIFGSLPVLTLEDSFSWSLWVKMDTDLNTNIILGNRRGPDGLEFDPREFIKFTGLTFEWHQNVIGENVDYADVPLDVWTHLAIVKDGPTLTHYRDGVAAETMAITGAPLNGQPLYFGGQGFENWRGYMSDVRLYNLALSDTEITDLFENKGGSVGLTNFRITAISVDSDKNVSITFNSRPNRQYRLDVSTSMLAEGLNPGGWFEVNDEIDSAGELTTTTLNGDEFPFTANEDRMFFKLIELPLLRP